MPHHLRLVDGLGLTALRPWVSLPHRRASLREHPRTQIVTGGTLSWLPGMGGGFTSDDE